MLGGVAWFPGFVGAWFPGRVGARGGVRDIVARGCGGFLMAGRRVWALFPPQVELVWSLVLAECACSLTLSQVAVLGRFESIEKKPRVRVDLAL